MPKLQEILAYLEYRFPPELAETWDNVGLLIGDPGRPVRKIMTCLTLTPETAREAVEREADLVVSHHPFPFHSLKRITVETPTGRLLWELIGAKISLYSPHTSHDNADRGINRQLAERLGMQEIVPLSGSAGRFGRLSEPFPFFELLRNVRSALKIPNLQYVDAGREMISRLAIACGAAGEFLEPAAAAGAEALLLGETRFHTYLDAKALGVSLILPGHFASERFALERLALQIGETFPDIECWAGEQETDPLGNFV